MLADLDNMLKTGGAAAFLALTLLQCVKVWRDLPELKKENQAATIQKGLIMHRLRFPMVFLAISAGLFGWSYDSSSEPGPQLLVAAGPDATTAEPSPVTSPPASGSTAVSDDTVGESSDKPCKKIVIVMPPFHNETDRDNMVPSRYDADKDIDQYSTLSAKRFRRKLSKAIRRSSSAECFEIVTDRQIADTLEKLDQGYSGRFDEKTQLEIGRLLQAGIVARGTIESFDVTSWHEGQPDETKTFKVRISIEFVLLKTGTVVPEFDGTGKKVHSGSGLSTPEKNGFSQALDDAVVKAFESQEMAVLIQELKRSR